MQFYQRNEEALANELNELERRAAEWGVQVPMLYLNPGSTLVRILPPFSEAGIFYSKVYKHRVQRGKGADVFVCPERMADTFCPVCEKNREFINSKDSAKMDYARDNLRVREAVLYNALVLSAPANGKGEVPVFGTVYVLEAPITAHRQIISKDQDPAAGWHDITNPENGVNLVIKRTGVKFDTKYEVTPHGGGRTNLFADLTSRGIDPNSLVLYDLEKVYSVPSEDFLKEVMGNIPKTFGAPVQQAGPTNASAFRPVAAQPAPAPAAPAPAQTAQTSATPIQPQPVVQAGPPAPTSGAPAVPPPPPQS